MGIPFVPGQKQRTVGCPHNLERLIKHGASSVANVPDERGRPTPRLQYVAGDSITLVCPYGCPDVTVAVASQQYNFRG